MKLEGSGYFLMDLVEPTLLLNKPMASQLIAIKVMPRMLVLRHSMHRDTGYIGGQAKLMIDNKDIAEVAQSAEFRITVPPSDQVVVEWKPGFGDSSDIMPPAF